ncbi:hypothetical protein [Labilibaculum antarcticum]|uniref:Uncharacterized protein n=1 Tax=Labilibaculum antarcticum TaxID=1717717 RepID=A0A1Y1CF39_9BACT|nr:hypothetical protein [Labilibaculum antarcticum]BAX78945.1 hypothetical protein ALGA_0552 [Labilibaculum antarcticum]
MNKIFNKIGLFLAMTLLILGSCDDDYEAPGTEPSHVYATTSFGDTENRTQVNSLMSFIDLSVGIENRTWTFTDDAIDAGYAKISTSTDAVVKTRFTQSGVHNVMLSQTFANNVWVGEGQKTTTVYDTIISVIVLDSVKASFSASRVIEGTALINQDGALNDVMAGREIQFTQTTAELMGATDFQWFFTKQGGLTSNYDEGVITAKLSSVGIYDAMFVASNAFSRDTITYKSYMNVGPSTDPVELLGIMAEGGLRLSFGRDMEYPTTCDPASFTLSVINDGIPYPIAVTEVKRDASEKNIIILSLDSDLFNSDDVLVSYDATVGNLITSDGMLATSFSDAKAGFIPGVNLLVSSAYDYGLETYSTDSWKYLWWGAPWDAYTFEVSDAQLYSGKKSGHVTMDAAGGMIMGLKNADNTAFVTFPTESGKLYELGCWIYMESIGDRASSPDLRFYWQASTDWSVGGAVFDPEFEEGKWVYTSWKVKSPGDGNNSFLIRGDNQGNSEACSFYMDDISMSILDVR